MKNYFNLCLAFLFSLFLNTFIFAIDDSQIKFFPIQHATFVIQTPENVVYVDPVGDTNAFKQYPAPNIILITDIHPDHLDKNAINSLKKEDTVVIGPKAVISELNFGEILNYGDSKQINNISIKAIAAYNTTPERLKFHEKGRGNGYLLNTANKTIYISGDTEDIPEIRSLTNVDYAFICMNLPYTMTVEQAASCILEIKPKVVFPYHYRGTEGLSDLEKFKKLVSENPDIKIEVLKWY